MSFANRVQERTRLKNGRPADAQIGSRPLRHKICGRRMNIFPKTSLLVSLPIESQNLPICASAGRLFFRRVRSCTRFALFIVLLSTNVVHAQNKPPHLSLEQAATATELPVPAWGAYSAQHLAPCLLTNRLQGQLFTFPIVVGQRSDAFVFKPRQLKPERVKSNGVAWGFRPFKR